LKKLKNLSRDEAKRRFRKEGKDIHGSKKFNKTISKNKGKGKTGKPIYERSGDGEYHYHTPDRKNVKGGAGGHAFTNSGFVIPLSSLGNDIFGDNLFGDAINFFNPLSDAQDLIDLLSGKSD
jgi:hypothetical protein